MSKQDRILRLLDLLYHRRSVSVRRIVAECGVTERTVYRYVHDISKAGYAVYWDAQRGGYRLNRDRELTLERFDVAEIIEILVALRALGQRCSRHYQPKLSDLCHKFRACQSYPIDEVADEIDNLEQSAGTIDNLDALLTRAILRAAAITATPLRLQIKKRGCGQIEVVVQVSRLVLSDDWELHDEAALTSRAVRLRDIVAADVLLPRSN